MNVKALTHFLIALTVLVGSIGAYVFWHRMVVAASQEAAGLVAQIEQTKRSADTSRQSKQQLTAIVDDEVAVRQYFVAPADIVPFLQTLEKTGSGLSAKVEVLSVAAAQTPRPHLTLSLTITGGFDSVLRTLGAIEYAPYDISIKTLSFDTANSGLWTANATVFVGTASSTPASSPAP